jgi:copper chaperone CopZ
MNTTTSLITTLALANSPAARTSQPAHPPRRQGARSINTATGALLLAALGLLAACSGPATTTVATLGQDGVFVALPKPAEGIAHSVTKGDLDELRSTNSIEGDAAELWVNGMGCPQCVTNIDLELEDLPGVASTRVDLGSGKVYVTFTGTKRPTPAQLEKAVGDAGNTLVKLVVAPRS